MMERDGREGGYGHGEKKGKENEREREGLEGTGRMGRKRGVAWVTEKGRREGKDVTEGKVRM